LGFTYRRHIKEFRKLIEDMGRIYSDGTHILNVKRNFTDMTHILFFGLFTLMGRMSRAHFSSQL